MQPAQAIWESRYLNSTEAYAVVLRSLGRQSWWRRAVEMFLEMPEKQLAVDLRALNGVLSACEEGGAWPWAIQLMADAVPELLPDVPCLRKALSSCRKGCAWRWALVLLDDFEGFGFLVDATTLRQAIAACEGAGREARDAKVALERRRKRQEVAHDARWPIQKKPVKTEVSERRTMKQEAMKKLSMGTTSGPEAMGYISLLRANFKLSCKEYTMLISFLSTRTLWKSALTLFSEMPEREAIPDQTAYTTAIAACRLAKRWTHALELYAKMCDELMPPTISTLNALISVCGQSERWREALLVFEEIAGFSLRPDGVTLKATLEAATEGRQWPLALRLLRATPQPEAYHFNQALRACERSSCWRESLQLLKVPLWHLCCQCRKLLESGLGLAGGGGAEWAASTARKCGGSAQCLPGGKAVGLCLAALAEGFGARKYSLGDGNGGIPLPDPMAGDSGATSSLPLLLACRNVPACLAREPGAWSLNIGQETGGQKASA
ncbi:unnamed protein product [Durusdinium trenchii]|uniref:Pentatricopeptide repeat-containing protein, chloroplastic n=1 Tax=Durusdinium trenchii TaxID=1381693 RepID=A0ABP0N8U0_9DINO